MTKTTRLLSVSVPVADQDRALAFYRDVLGFDVLMDEEIWPGSRLVEVAPPGSPIALVLLPVGSDIPLAIRMETPDAEAAHAALREAGVHVHNDDVVRLPGIPAMFSFEDPDGNGLVYLEPEPARDSPVQT